MTTITKSPISEGYRAFCYHRHKKQHLGDDICYNGICKSLQYLHRR